MLLFLIICLQKLNSLTKIYLNTAMFDLDNFFKEPGSLTINYRENGILSVQSARMLYVLHNASDSMHPCRG